MHDRTSYFMQIAPLSAYNATHEMQAQHSSSKKLSVSVHPITLSERCVCACESYIATATSYPSLVSKVDAHCCLPYPTVSTTMITAATTNHPSSLDHTTAESQLLIAYSTLYVPCLS